MLRFMLGANAEEAAQLPTLRQLQGLLDNEAAEPPHALSVLSKPEDSHAHPTTTLPAPTAVCSTVPSTTSKTIAPVPSATLYNSGVARSRDDGYVMPVLPPPPLSEAQRRNLPEEAQQHTIVECQLEPESDKNVVGPDKYRRTGSTQGATKVEVEMVPIASRSSAAATASTVPTQPPSPAASSPGRTASMLGFLVDRCGEPSSSFPTLQRLSHMLADAAESHAQTPTKAAAPAQEAAPAAPPATAPAETAAVVNLPLAIPLPVVPGQSEWDGVFVVATPPPTLPFDKFYDAAASAPIEQQHLQKERTGETAGEGGACAPPRHPQRAHPFENAEIHSPQSDLSSARRQPNKSKPHTNASASALRLDGKGSLVPSSGRRARRSAPASATSSSAAPAGRASPQPSAWYAPDHARVAGRPPAPVSTTDAATLVMASRGLTRREKMPYAERFMRALYYRSASHSPQPQRDGPSRQLVVQRLYDRIQHAEQLESMNPLRIRHVETPASEGTSSRVVNRLERDVQRAAAYESGDVDMSMGTPSSVSSGRLQHASGRVSGKISARDVPRPPSQQPPSRRSRSTRPLSSRPPLATPLMTTTTTTTTTTALLPRAVRGLSAGSSSGHRSISSSAAHGRRVAAQPYQVPSLAIVGEHLSVPTMEHDGLRLRSRFLT